MRSLCVATWARWPALRRSSLWKRPKTRALFALLAFALLGERGQAENCISLYPTNSLDRKVCLCRQFLSAPSAPGCKRICGPSTGYRFKQFHCEPLAQDALRSPARPPELGTHVAIPAAELEAPRGSSDKRAPLRMVSNSEPIRGSTGASPGGSDSIRAQDSTRPPDASAVNAAPRVSAAVKLAQRSVSNPQQSYPRADTNNAQGHLCFNVDPKTGRRCIPAPGSPVVDMNTTLADGTVVTRFNWKFANSCTRDVQVTVRQDNGSSAMRVGGKNSRTFYCLSFEGCHKFTGYSEKCGN
jgi:hypothetical protein